MAENMIDLNGLVHVWSKVKTLTADCVKADSLATVATSGSYNDLGDKPTIPSAYTLPTASNTVMGGVKIGSNISVSSGTISITKSNVTSALGYTPPVSDTTYVNATASAAGLMSSSDKSKLDSIAANANNYIHPASHPASMITGLAAVATSGSYNDLSDKPTIPSAYTLPTASNTVMGGVKIGSNISVSSGTISITKSNVTSALGYTPPVSDTTYVNATASAAGLMSSSDKSKLDSIAANANNYIHPASHPASMITGLAAVATSGSYSDLSNKPTIPVVPTNVSAFINDAGYLTQHQSLDDYAKKTDVNTALADKLGINDTAAAAIKDGAGNTISTTYTSKADVSALLSTKLGVTATAYAAARDGAGNNIVDTYARKTDIPNITVDTELSSTSPNPVQNKVIKVALDGKLGKNDTAVNASKVNNLTVETAVPKNAKFTDTVYMHPSTHPVSMITGLASVATSGSYNDLTDKPVIPGAYTLPNATSSTLGGVKIGNNISVTNGTISLSQTDVTSALGYTPPASDTTYGDATTTSSGLMSSTDKVKLNGIADNANYYIHPPTHPASMISGLATVATSGNYNDLANKPGDATKSSAGLMSAADKSKLDGISSDAGSVKMIVYS